MIEPIDSNGFGTPERDSMLSRKKIAILQSNYIPWKGYFDLISNVDEFILYDDVQYTKNDWRNRNKIKTPNGSIWLTIPVKHSTNQSIKEIIVNDQKWRIKHWKTIKQNYTKSKYFNDYKEIFEGLYLNSNHEFLSQINYLFLTTICRILKITTKISWSMDYDLTTGKTERLVDLCKQAGAQQYISGPSAKSYINEKIFKKENISLLYLDYSGYSEHRQLYPPFEHNVSIIDLLFNEGDNARWFLKSFFNKGISRLTE